VEPSIWQSDTRWCRGSGAEVHGRAHGDCSLQWSEDDYNALVFEEMRHPGNRLHIGSPTIELSLRRGSGTTISPDAPGHVLTLGHTIPPLGVLGSSNIGVPFVSKLRLRRYRLPTPVVDPLCLLMLMSEAQRLQ